MLAARLPGNSNYDNPRPGRSGVALSQYFPYPPRGPITSPTSRAARLETGRPLRGRRGRGDRLRHQRCGHHVTSGHLRNHLGDDSAFP